MTLYQLSELTEGFPAPLDIPASAVQQAMAADTVLIVLDDDPTGTQSAANLPALTRWKQEDLAWALSQNTPAVYVMTNSRSLDPDQAAAINVSVAEAAYAAARDAGKRPIFVSRSDSTLRGHFPLEPDALAGVVEKQEGPIDGYIIVPAFGDAGRITIDSVHYAGNAATGFQPVGETEFAHDATFGYSSSRLTEWVEEKTQGDVAATDVLCIKLRTIRSTSNDIAAELLHAAHRQPIVVDIVDEYDLRALALGILQAERMGKRFIYRVGPPFVRARIGQKTPKVLSPETIAASRHLPATVAGGLIVVGSHVPTTTQQLNHLLKHSSPSVIELDVRAVLAENSQRYLDSLHTQLVQAIRQGNVVFHTSRELVTGVSGEESLSIARKVSQALVTAVNRIVHEVTPRFVVAKGGITSSDVASQGLEMTKAMVIGPMQPGIISLWSTAEGPAAGVPYIVFAGNVGTDSSLTDVVSVLSQDSSLSH
ncbi:hypothetical protein AN398_00775 [Corynebacterium pseudotuberculosis]|uniref:four-carbon acid sugar kinase family protein n=1 Tax=Corynebacterium pseudotuberculosis TaxID=1719 RepID=UPI000737C555|nr:four-carbon acid sugar kinase family protein [Corynebacterium pseudotuberculosis]ALU20763.1 hypothetical protein AN398_00775 [Corynebacterium pseudotuberculosis]